MYQGQVIAHRRVSLRRGDLGDEEIRIRLYLDAAEGIAGADAIGSLNPADNGIGSRRGVDGIDGIDDPAAVAGGPVLGQNVRVIGEDSRRIENSKVR